MNIIDRRPNPKGKSLSNRQRFIARAKTELRGAVQEALRKRNVADVDHGEQVSIPAKGLAEPTFRYDRRSGKSDYVVPGNKEYVVGDEIPRPSGGSGGNGSEGSPDGDGEDSFEFALSKEEFLDLFFEGLKLPRLVEKMFKKSMALYFVRAGYTLSGSPANLAVVRTMRNAQARRISSKGSKSLEEKALEETIREADARQESARAAELFEQLIELRKRRPRSVHARGNVPYIDPVDVRYKNFAAISKPNTHAVMFCLMDVSGSMTEKMKDLAKQFFMLLHIFLERRYRTVDIVFVRHTSTAEEVDEETFFHSRETGGTIVSTALEKMLAIVRERYPLDAWNIYGAQASDGGNYAADNSRCIELLDGSVLPLCQYFAYIEVGDGPKGLMGLARRSDLWDSYATVAPKYPASFAMRCVGDRTQIFSVFHELFSKERT